jgi:glyoxylase-like metal-dependent hydrolase (beta-lactamase superfamily II)
MADIDVTKLDNVCVYDNKMFGFERWCSSFIIAGKKVALIDTGTPPSYNFCKSGIESHGFALKDVSYIFITHIHFDHCGCAGMLMKDMPNATLLTHPRIAKHMVDPSVVNANTRSQAGEKMGLRFGEMVPIPESQVRGLTDGEVIDLGDGNKLRAIFAPGHNVSHIMVLNEKDNGLFAGDAPGLYFGDCDALLMPSPVGSDLDLAMQSLNNLEKLSPKRFYLGHYGIYTQPEKLIKRARAAIQQRIDVGMKTLKEGKPDELLTNLIKSLEPEIDKLHKARGEELYKYITGELLPMWTRGFKGYYEKLQEKQ